MQALSDDGTGSASSASLTNCSPALVYHMVSTLRALQEPLICSLITDNTPSTHVASWPKNPPPPGLLLLLLNESDAVRQWVGKQLSQSKPIEKECFVKPYDTVVGIFASVLSRTDSDIQESYPIAEHNVKMFEALLSASSSVAWRGLAILVPLLPISVLSTSKPDFTTADIGKTICGHLHDNAPRSYLY